MTIENIYQKVITGNIYDFEVASAHNCKMYQQQTRAKDLPEIEARFISENHKGCCLHYGMALIHLLHEAGYRVYLTVTPEEDGGNHCSVLYFIGDEYYIADPVEDVIHGTTNQHMAIKYDTFVANAIRHEIKHVDIYGKCGDELFFTQTFLKDNALNLADLI